MTNEISGLLLSQIEYEQYPLLLGAVLLHYI